MYDAHLVLSRISHHVALVLVLGGVALICNYVFFWEAARLAARDRCVPFLMIAVGLWFAHDATYLLDAGRWFGHYHHWFPRLFWFGLMVTFAFEVTYVVQIWRYGRDELAPRLTRSAYQLYVVGALAFSVVLWAITKQTLADPLFLMTFMLTAVWALVSNIALALRRGDRRGQSTRQWVAYTGMIASYGAVSVAVFGGRFTQAPWILMCLAGVLGGLGMTYWVSRPQRSQSVVPPAQVRSGLR
jgi:hypothetical protein